MSGDSENILIFLIFIGFWGTVIYGITCLDSPKYWPNYPKAPVEQADKRRQEKQERALLKKLKNKYEKERGGK